jgi:hypothetical protein
MQVRSFHKSDESRAVAKAVSASEIRKLPKEEREKVLEAQYKLGAKFYAEDPNSIIQATQHIHE